ncbi:hypothetical protein MMC29_004030 [Sticta canariensis]|nr:hypothetical protein [Sticta canariensis]
MEPAQPFRESFDPKKHLDFTPPSKIHTMRNIKLPEHTGVSPIAVSEPFQFFTPEAIRRMRSEIMSKDNSETLAIVSKIAGIDLVPEMDFEIAHINLSMKSEEQKQVELAASSLERELTEADEGIAGCPWEEDKPIVDWHTDSYPFVCVTMLSDCTDMIGGETALKTGDGDIMKVRGPQMGCSVILQGRYIEHQALRALGTTERITMVTSFRPRDPTVRDDTVLTTVRPISDLSQLYFQFSEYRLEMLQERIRLRLEKMRETMLAGNKFETAVLKGFLKEQENFLAHMNKEIVEDDQVIKGSIDDSHLFMDRPSKQEASKQQIKRKRVSSQRPRIVRSNRSFRQ